MITRRKLLQAGGLWLTGLTLGLSRFAWSSSNSKEEAIEIRMISDLAETFVAFDPIGLRIRPGRRIRWINDSDNVHTATAYHPANDRHPLRIPSAAKPWNSGYLMHRGDSFSLKLTVEGVYDYYCKPHEAAGMVGRIIVAEPGKVDPMVFETYPAESGRPEWKKVPEAALRNFPPVEMILRKGRVAAPDMYS
jgi:plastocyanin